MNFGEDDLIIDLGAQWIHGIGPGVAGDRTWEGILNPIYKIAVENNKRTVKTWLLEERIQKTFWWKGGEVIHDVWKMLEEIEEYLYSNKDEFSDDESIYSALKKKFNHDNDIEVQ